MILEVVRLSSIWEMEIFYSDMSRRVRVMVSNGYYCDYPIMYDSGSIAFDNPHRVPAHIVDAITRKMAQLYAIGVYGREIDKETAARLMGVNLKGKAAHL